MYEHFATKFPIETVYKAVVTFLMGALWFLNRVSFCSLLIQLQMKTWWKSNLTIYNHIPNTFLI